MIPTGENFEITGDVTLDNEFDFDVEWKLDKGDSAQDPGYFRVNKYNDHANIKEFNLEITYQDKYGIDLYLKNPTIYMDLEWYINWDYWPPIYYWFDVLISADEWDCTLIWTDNQNPPYTWYIDVPLPS